MYIHIVGDCRKRAAKAVEQLLFDRSLDIAASVLRIDRLVEASPTTAEPVCLARLVVLRRVEFLLQMCREFLAQLGCCAALDYAFVDQLLGIEIADFFVLPDRFIH